MQPGAHTDPSAHQDEVLVAISGSDSSPRLVHAAAELARAYDASWEAIHIETPDATVPVDDPNAAADTLALASQLGAAIATIPAATVADGIDSHLSASPAKHLVLGRSHRSAWARVWRGSIADILLDRHPALILHLLPSTREAPATRRPSPLTAKSPPIHFAIAAGLAGVALAFALLLQRALGMRGLDLLLLFPVTFISARFGLRPALVSVLVSVLGYNFLLLKPAFSFAVTAPENVILLIVLLAVALYVGTLTSSLRGRIALSDRSARDNARIAAFAQRLTSLSDWDGTAQAVSEQFATMLNVNAIVLREIAGRLVVAGGAASDTPFGPIATAALDLAWSSGEEAGNGTEQLPACEWRFQPLKTSLGTLAVLAVARDDGRNPVRSDQAMLFSTLVAQASLSLERLRLEDVQLEHAVEQA